MHSDRNPDDSWDKGGIRLLRHPGTDILPGSNKDSLPGRNSLPGQNWGIRQNSRVVTHRNTDTLTLAHRDGNFQGRCFQHHPNSRTDLDCKELT